MDTKQLLNDEDLTAVAGGNRDVWTGAVNIDFIPRLEKIAACASEADKAVLQGYIDTLRSTLGEDPQSASNMVRTMVLQYGRVQDEGIRSQVNYLVNMILECSRIFLSW